MLAPIQNAPLLSQDDDVSDDEPEEYLDLITAYNEQKKLQEQKKNQAAMANPVPSAYMMPIEQAPVQVVMPVKQQQTSVRQQPVA